MTDHKSRTKNKADNKDIITAVSIVLTLFLAVMAALSCFYQYNNTNRNTSGYVTSEKTQSVSGIAPAEMYRGIF